MAPASPDIRARRGGGVHVRLSASERDVLATLPEQMRPILDGSDDPVGARERLFPPAYDDPAAEAEYRSLAEEGLVVERLAALDAFAKTLEGGSRRRGDWTVDLSDEEAQAWLSAINDVRLTLGVLRGITDEEDWERPPDVSDAAGVMLHYLGWLQEELLSALAETLDDGDR